MRREAMKSRIIVQKQVGTGKYSLVYSARETEAVVDRVIDARNRALMDEAREMAPQLFGASTPGEVDPVHFLTDHGRMVMAQGDDRFVYRVFDFGLQERSKYYAFRDWADTPDGRWYLKKQDRRSGRWNPMPLESEAGRFVIPRDARTVFKNYCDHTFGGQTWFDVLNQMGGCPAEFVDAWNTVIDQRLQAAF